MMFNESMIWRRDERPIGARAGNGSRSKEKELSESPFLQKPALLKPSPQPK